MISHEVRKEQSAHGFGIVYSSPLFPSSDLKGSVYSSFYCHFIVKPMKFFSFVAILTATLLAGVASAAPLELSDPVTSTPDAGSGCKDVGGCVGILVV